MKTEVTSCDVCMETMSQSNNGANEFNERLGGGFSLSGWQLGVTEEYVDYDVCSIKCLANAIAQIGAGAA